MWIVEAATSDVIALQMNADTSISAFPDNDNLFSWVGTIKGPAATVCNCYLSRQKLGMSILLILILLKFKSTCFFHIQLNESVLLCRSTRACRTS